jgi:hypothetical protein
MPDEPRRKIESWPARSHFVGIDGLARSYGRRTSSRGNYMEDNTGLLARLVQIC